jgi:hypothetical protein
MLMHANIVLVMLGAYANQLVVCCSFGETKEQHEEEQSRKVLI